MLKRQIIQVAVAILIVVIGFAVRNLLAAQKKDPEKKTAEKVVRLVKARTISNDTLQQLIPINGKLSAKEKIEVYPEVTGVLLTTGKPFKVGQSFKKGETLLAIDGNESLLNLKAQRSSFINLVSQALPDIKIDYNSDFDAWKTYLNELTPSKALPELPSVSDPMLKNFLSGRNIYQQFYSIKSLENRQSKFTITAPFNGSVSLGNVNPGTVIRANQKVGEFIQDDVFEFEGAVAANDSRDIEPGDQVMLTNSSGKAYNGTISRIAKNVDPNTQRIALFADIKGENLKEGIYLEGTIAVSDLANTVEIDRNLILNDEYVFIIKDTVLAKKEIQVDHEFEQSAFVSGLSNGDVLLDQVIEGAYEGMLVKIDSSK